jgi:hypothetical protein
LYRGDLEAQRITNEILAFYGVDDLIELKANDVVPNAAAYIVKGTDRLVVYNPAFFSKLALSPGDLRTFKQFILAHEIAHHLNGHTLRGKNGEALVSPQNEIRADAFAARYLKAVGLTRPESDRLFQTLARAFQMSAPPVVSNPPVNDRRVQFQRTFEVASADALDLQKCRAEDERTKTSLQQTSEKLGQVIKEHTECTQRAEQRVSWAERNPHGRQYVIESAVMHVEYDDGEQIVAPSTMLIVHITMTYFVHALQDVQPGDFDEEFHSSLAQAVEWRTGSHSDSPQEEQPLRRARRINATIKAGESRMIVTGADYQFAWPFPVTRDVHDFRLGPLEDAWIYPNTEDVIGDFMLIVDTRNTIDLPKSGDALLVDIGSGKKQVATPDLRHGTRVNTLSMRWSNVQPRSRMGLMFRWTRRPSPAPMPPPVPPAGSATP